ncbi:fructosamine kinase family protein [Methylocucumis oryzae]|uniref:fructosamine kinase family protein n=1 Tax=Methylocucumis oryzae TaxID=1632867 RepID=UPI0023BA9500|nr:fructosamine kinase family protein [Methylocucumis oryzae]
MVLAQIFIALITKFIRWTKVIKTRKTLYNLYHILNHLNLFGSSYQHQAEQMMASLLAEL